MKSEPTKETAMHKLTAIAISGAALLAATLAACAGGQPGNTPASASTGPIAAAIDHGLDQAETELTTQNIPLDDHNNRLPRAEITPTGDLLIGGKSIVLTSAQRQQVLAYRQRLIAIGQEGIAVGRQGAALGLHAADTAIAAALSGQSDQQIRHKMQTETTGIQQTAQKLCDHLPAMMAAQQRLATAVPAFKPYATMTQKDIGDCRVDARHDSN
jgi:hypothetical protein